MKANLTLDYRAFLIPQAPAEAALTGTLTGVCGHRGGIYGDATRISGDVSYVCGDVTTLGGNMTYLSGYVGTHLRGRFSGALRGDISRLKGDVTGIHGYATGVSGDLDDCGITEEDRLKGVDIKTLVI